MNDAERWRTVAAWFEEAAATGHYYSLYRRFGFRPAVYATRGGIRDHRRMVSLLPSDWHDDDHLETYDAGGLACLALLMAHMAEDDGGNHRNEEAT